MMKAYILPILISHLLFGRGAPAEEDPAAAVSAQGNPVSAFHDSNLAYSWPAHSDDTIEMGQDRVAKLASRYSIHLQ